MRTALIVIDMQQGSFTSRTPRYDADGLVRRINVLADRVRSADGVVVFVQHDGPPDDPHHPDRPGWQLLPDLSLVDGDLFVRETSCDAFLATELDRILGDAGVDRVIITGCATDFCVDTTVRSALARRYTTVVPTDGHTTADRPHLSAQKIIEHHNAIWAVFISPIGAALTVPCAKVQL